MPHASAPTPRRNIAAGTVFSPAPRRLEKLIDTCWLATPSQAKIPTKHPCRNDCSYGNDQPAQHPAAPRHGTDEEMIDPTGGLLSARRRDLASGHERNQQSDDEEGEPEVGLDRPTPAVETPQGLLDPRGGLERLRCLFRRPTEQQSECADPTHPSKHRRANESEGESGDPEEQSRCARQNSSGLAVYWRPDPALRRGRRPRRP